MVHQYRPCTCSGASITLHFFYCRLLLTKGYTFVTYSCSRLINKCLSFQAVSTLTRLQPLNIAFHFYMLILGTKVSWINLQLDESIKYLTAGSYCQDQYYKTLFRLQNYKTILTPCIEYRASYNASTILQSLFTLLLNYKLSTEISESKSEYLPVYTLP